MNMSTDNNNHGISTCGCKGVRSCLFCEHLKGNGAISENAATVVHHFHYDPQLGRAVCEYGSPLSFPFPGVFLRENFLSEEEEEQLIKTLDQDVWNKSQSGRQKQDFGPKVNFKKHKVRLGGFCGLPASSRPLVERMLLEPVLEGFRPVEQCNLDYHPQRGSAIDPHLDDCWLWGERLVTVNMLSDTTLTMSLETGLAELVGGDVGPAEPGRGEEEEEVHVAVRLPRRSLVVLFGEARHKWKHAILRRDIDARRVCTTFRELSAEFLPGGEQSELGARLLDTALTFQGTPVR